VKKKKSAEEPKNFNKTVMVTCWMQMEYVIWLVGEI